ncbi:MAG: DUF2062 domain-containing protein [Bdellovibrionota bacterium]
MNFKYLHCVPTYNNPQTIAEVVIDLLKESPNDILVVDDGSDRSVETLVNEALLKAELQNTRIFFLRLKENLGKGKALQKAFKWALDHSYTHVITSDADSQHPATEVMKVYKRSCAEPWSLVIGNRNMNTENVPGISHFGRKFSNFWVKYQTNTQVSDSQSGLRCYPLIHIQNFNFFTKRFDFEIEILIRLIWNGVNIAEEPVAVVYQKGSKRVSHFDKIWDNVRITLLNTLLIILSLLKEQTAPFKLALAFGVGIFVGCTPFYGLHILMCAALSFFLKLNFVGLFAGTQISMPPLVPLLVPAAIKLGEAFTHKDGAYSFFIGTTLLGALLGTLGFFVAWIFLSSRERTRRREEKALQWKGEQRGGRLGNHFLKLLMRTFGLRTCYICVAIFVVPYFYLFAPKARKASNEYWKTIEPQLSFAHRNIKILKHFYEYAVTLLDSVYLSIKGENAFALRSSGYEELKASLDKEKGLLMLTAHCGAWYLASRALKRHRFKHSIHIVHFREPRD